MDPIMKLAGGLIAQEMARAQTYSQNIANASTHGYKRSVVFDQALQDGAPMPRDPSAGKTVRSGRPLDVLADGGLLEVAKDGVRGFLGSAAFERDADGRLRTGSGWVLQSAEGGDVIVEGASVTVERDGTVLADGRRAGAIRLVALAVGVTAVPAPDGVLRLADRELVEAPAAQVQSGFLEASNVSVSDEMQRLMESVRRVESGQKLVHVYDDMVGTVLQRLGEF